MIEVKIKDIEYKFNFSGLSDEQIDLELFNLVCETAKFENYNNLIQEVIEVSHHAIQKEKARRAVAKIVEDFKIESIVNLCLTGE